MRRLALALIAALFLAGCEGSDIGTKQAVGAIAGAAAGGLLGSQIGAGTGRLAATAAGTALGAFLGSEIGKSLDRADRLHMDRTRQRALERNPTGTTSVWENPDSGHSGTVTPTETTYNTGGQPCREYTSTIYVDGKQETVTSRACRRADGTWHTVES